MGAKVLGGLEEPSWGEKEKEGPEEQRRTKRNRDGFPRIRSFCAGDPELTSADGLLMLVLEA